MHTHARTHMRICAHTATAVIKWAVATITRSGLLVISGFELIFTEVELPRLKCRLVQKPHRYTKLYTIMLFLGAAVA